MVWKNYWHDIVVRHRVIIEGWPKDVRFGNLSDVATSLHILDKLHCHWKSGQTYFRVLDDSEFEALDKEHAKNVANGDEVIPARKTQRDKGVKRKGSTDGPRRKKRRTASVVSSDSEAENQPIASMSTSNAA
jgi:hypothetical protein